MKFARPRLMRWNSNAISDHNRSPVSVDFERIETSQRMANGRLRKYVVATKRTFSVSWEMLPRIDSKTVDGYWGGQSMLNFYNATTGTFTLELTHNDSTVENVAVTFTDFSYTVAKRGAVEYWNVNATMEEI